MGETSGDSPSDPGVRADTVTVAGRALRYRHVASSARAVPVVLCNGLGINMELARRLTAALSPRPVVLFDAPGVGGSPRPPVPMTFGELADLVAALLDHLGYRRADVFGYSWGGGIAQEFAHRHAHRCGHLVLAATTPGMAMAALLQAWRSALVDPAGIAATLLDLAPGGTGLDELFSDYKTSDSKSYAYQLITGLTWSSARWLGRLALPTLVMAATGDRLVPQEQAVLLQRMISGATLRMIPGNHLVFLTHPERYVRYLDRFLDADERV